MLKASIYSRCLTFTSSESCTIVSLSRSRIQASEMLIKCVTLTYLSLCVVGCCVEMMLE